MRAANLVLFLLFLSPIGCAMQESVTLRPDVAYIVFRDAGPEMVFHLDDGEARVISYGPGETRYGIPPGKHTVEVREKDVVLARRVIFLSTGQVFEFPIPRNP